MVVMLNRVDMDLTYGVDCGEEPERAGISKVNATSTTTVEVEFNVPVDADSAEDVSHYAVSGDSDIDVSSATVLDASTVELTLAQSTEANGDYTLSVSDMLTADGEDFSDTGDFSGYTTTPQGEGTLDVALSSKNPVGDTVPQGAIGVVLLSLDFSASCDDAVTLTNVTVLHEGFGDEADIDGVYASMDGGRVSRKRTIDSEDQTADLRFSTPIVIDACDSVTLDLVADISTTAVTSAEHNFVVELPSDVTSNAREVEGNFPHRGNTFRIAAVDTGILSVAYRTVSPDEVEVGDKTVVVGKFEVSANSTEDQTVYAMTFENDGTAGDGDIENIKIRRTDGTVLTNTASSTVGDYVTVLFDPPFTVLEGDNITLEIVADVVAGAGDTVKLHFEEKSDVFSVGSLYGYGVNGQLYGSFISLPTETTSLPDTVTIDAGEFTLEISGPQQTSFTTDADDAVLANINLTTGGEEVDVKDLFIAIEGETSTGANLTTDGSSATDQIHEVLEDVELRNEKTGQTIDGVRLTGSTDFAADSGGSNEGSYQVYRFDDFIVNGKETYQLRVDFISGGTHPQDGDRFKVHVCGESKLLSDGATNTTGCNFGDLLATASTAYQMDVEGLSTGDRIRDVRPRGVISGNFQLIAGAGLTVAVKDVPLTDTVVKNADNINLLRFEVRAEEAEDILITKFAFNAQSGSLQNGQNYTLWVDTDGDSSVDTKLQSGVASQSSKVTFNELTGGGFVVPKEETVMFEVHADISASPASLDLMIRFDSGATDYIEAEEVDDGSSLSGIKTNGTCTTTCAIISTVKNSTNYTIINQGDLFVTKDTQPLRNRQLLGGTLSDEILRLQFHSENEDIDVTDIQINSSGSTATSIDRLELYKDGATTYFALATVGGCGSDDVESVNAQNTNVSTTTAFCANMESRQLVIPEGSDIDVIVKARMKTDANGAITDQNIALYISPQASSENSTGTGAVRARGDESTNQLDANAGNSGTSSGAVFIGRATTGGANVRIVGNANETVLSKLKSLTDAMGLATGTAVPTGNDQPFAKFRFETHPHGNSRDGLNDWALSGIIFNVSATNVVLSGSAFQFYNSANATVKEDCRSLTTGGVQIHLQASGSFLVQCKSLLDSGSPDTQIDQASSATFVLEGNMVNADVTAASTSTLQVSIQNFDNIQNLTFAATASHLQWRDLDNGSVAAATATTATFNWIEYSETIVRSTSFQS